MRKRIMGSEIEWCILVKIKGKTAIHFFEYEEEKNTARFLNECFPEKLLFKNFHLPCSFAANGAKIYFDNGVFEYATPEASSARDVVRYEKAGEIITEEAVKKANEVFGPHTRFFCYKNNLDAKKRSLGTHESYLVARSEKTELQNIENIARILNPFLITRQIFAGNGWVEKTGSDEKLSYFLSQRALVMERVIGDGNINNRPIINASKFAYADQRYLRLHLMLGDANMCETAIFLKFGAVSILLDMIESGFLKKSPIGENLFNAVAAMKTFSQDNSLRVSCKFEKKSYTAADVQEVYLNAARKFCEEKGLLSGEYGKILNLWEKMTDLSRKPKPHEHLAPYADWAAKKLLIEQDMERNGYKWGDKFRGSADKSGYYRAKILDFEFHKNAPDGCARIMTEQRKNGKKTGIIKRMVSDEEIKSVIWNPVPNATRAWARVKQLKYLEELAKKHGCGLETTVHWESTCAAITDKPRNGPKWSYFEFKNGDPFLAKPRLPRKK